MTHPDDAFDLAVHGEIEKMIKLQIEEMIRVFRYHRGFTRAKVIEELCNGDGKFDHGLCAIAEMFSLSRHDVNERVSAFIEAEKEEEFERAVRAALAAEVDA